MRMTFTQRSQFYLGIPSAVNLGDMDRREEF